MLKKTQTEEENILFCRLIHLVMDNLYYNVENVFQPPRWNNHYQDCKKWYKLVHGKSLRIKR